MLLLIITPSLTILHTLPIVKKLLNKINFMSTTELACTIAVTKGI